MNTTTTSACNQTTVELALHDISADRTVTVSVATLIVAGYTAADIEASERHIEELAKIGVPRPTTVPAFYPLPTDLLTGDRSLSASSRSSGEVEPVLYVTAEGSFVGIGSDHTDRHIERDSILDSKAACLKPLGSDVIPLPEYLSRYEELVLASWVDGRPYQCGPAATLLRPTEVLERYARLTGEQIQPGTAVFLGTVPLLGGTFSYGSRYELALLGPSEILLRHGYSVTLHD